jgi:hypothetical protein
VSLAPRRVNPDGTRAAEHLYPGFWRRYLRATTIGGDGEPFGDASVIFSPNSLALFSQSLRPGAFSTPVLFTELLSNRTLAGYIIIPDAQDVIAINARLRVDPELLTHALLEEFVHAHQIIEGLDYAKQQVDFPYEDRPYELEAKALATSLLGWEPDERTLSQLRPVPPGPLFDD